MRTFPVWSGLAAFTLPALLTVAHSAPPSHKTTSARLTKAARSARSRPKAASAPKLRAMANIDTYQAGQKPTTIHASGTVLLPDGTRAKDAKVYLSWRNNGGGMEFRRLSLDAEGRFAQNVTVKNVMGEAVGLVAYAPGQGMALEVRQKNHMAGQPVTLKLQAGTTLSGRVIRPDGTPVANKDLYASGLNMAMIASFNSSLEIMSQEMSDAADRATTPSGQGAATAQREVERKMQRFEFLQGADKLLPSLDLMSFLHAKTDSEGRFTLTNVPTQSGIRIAITGGLALARGSQGTLFVSNASSQSTGILVATKKSDVTVRVINSASAKPAQGAQVMVVARNAAAEMSIMGGENQNNIAWQEVTNAQGKAVLHNMLPGDYLVSVAGTVRDLHVAEQGTAPVVISTRLDSLKGRVVDERGKPVANLDIALNAAMKSEAVMMSAMGQARVADRLGSAPQVIARTGDDGKFEIPNFAWGDGDVIVQARRGNDLAFWSGNAGKIGSCLTLTLRKNALITVTGRLLDPRRRSVGKLTCQTLHWQATPRSAWFATAHEVQTDSQGRFRVTGLERGESFSIIATDQRNPGKQTLTNFESPRFDTPPTGETQDLGDVTVHESDDSQDIQDIYGGDMGEFTRSGAFQKLLPTPDTQEVTAAKAALEEYSRALSSGNLDAMQQEMARISPGWSADRAALLQQAALTAPAETGALSGASLQPLRFVPAIATALVQQSVQGMMLNSAPSPASPGDNDSSANWIFFDSGREGSGRIAAVLHKEDGRWRVVAIPSSQAMMLNSLVFDQMVMRARRISSAVSASTAVASLPEDQLDAARKSGTAYLQAWNEGRQDAMRSLTSPSAPNFANDTAIFKKLLEKRLDEGICPLNEEVPTLQPLNDLSNAEQARLNGFALQLNASRINRVQMAQQRINVVQQAGIVGEQASTKNVVETNAVAAADKKPAVGHMPAFATFQYEAQGRKFLMLMERKNDSWQVLEPALPM